MAPSLLDTFRVLSAFAPARVDLAQAPWDAYVEWAVAQGLAPLAAYNLEYRLAGSGAPEWAKDRLLSVYQAAVNDNVMKLVNFKHCLDDLVGRRLVLLGAACFAETVYPHVGFRPVGEIRVLVSPADVDGLAGYLRHAEFKPAPGGEGSGVRLLTDGRTELYLHSRVLGEAADREVLGRAEPVRAFGPSAFRLRLEDALVVHAVLAAKAGFDVPMLEWLDLRELALGAPHMGGAYSRPPDPAAVKALAQSAGHARALWAALGVLERLFPETAAAAAAMRPDLSFPVRALLEKAVVEPVSAVGGRGTFKGEDALRALLSGA